MAHLTLVGLSEDGTRLLLVDDAGAEFTLGVDSKLRAALRGEHARLGQLEIEMDSVLRPRDIQARIRSGETPEAVAAAAKTTVDKIMPFAAPVLAEREHVAERAQRSSVRRKAGESPARSRTLGEAVAGHLRTLNVAPETVTWDAFRREDGRWSLTGDFATGSRKGAARFAYDAPGNFVVTENDDARWLIGDLPDAPSRPAGPRGPGKERRLSAVPNEELPLGDDAIEMVRDETPGEQAADLTETAAKVRGDAAPAEDEEASFIEEVLPEDEAAATPAETAAPEPAPPPPRRPGRKKGARASVPSWDEIMFGGGKQD